MATKARKGQSEAGREEPRPPAAEHISDLRVIDIARVQAPAEVADPDDDILSGSLGEIGQLNPLILDSTMTVHGGRRRYWAALRRGDRTVWCRVYEDTQAAELAGIDEDLIRTHRTVLERAEQLARRRDILARMGRLHGPGRPANCDTVTQMTVGDLADQAGVSRRTLQRAARIAERIPADLRADLRGTPVEDSSRQLLAIADMAPEKQTEVIALLRAGAIDRVSAAVEQASSHQAPVEQEDSVPEAAKQDDPPPAGPPALVGRAEAPPAEPPQGSGGERPPSTGERPAVTRPAADRINAVEADMQVESSGSIIITAPPLPMRRVTPTSYRVKIVPRWRAELRSELDRQDHATAVLILPDLDEGGRDAR